MTSETKSKRNIFAAAARIVLAAVFFYAIISLVPQARIQADDEGTYPDYLDAERNFLLCGMHQGTGWYIDKTSIEVTKHEPPNYEIIINVLTVPNMDQGNRDYTVEMRRWKYNWLDRKMYLYNESDDTWKYIPPSGSFAETGHEFSGEMAFYLAYKVKFYGGRKYYNPFLKEMVPPNCGTYLYKIVDNARTGNE